MVNYTRDERLMLYRGLVMGLNNDQVANILNYSFHNGKIVRTGRSVHNQKTYLGDNVEYFKGRSIKNIREAITCAAIAGYE